MRNVLWPMAATILLLPAAAMSQSTLLITPSEVPWVESRSRPGSKIAILEGNPSTPGTFMALAKFPANYEVAPHYHSSTERGVVIAGGIYVGMGARADRAKVKHLPAGSVFVFPSLTPHYYYTTEETTIQIISTGPFSITPAQAP
jgi:quercetin dioxygenase-like cupin family protein